MTRWMHPPERERQREQARFDPVVEGTRHRLSSELSLAIWERVRADATDGAGRCDDEQAQRRFHELAALLAARGGRLRPDVGRLTRVGTEIAGAPPGPWRIPELAPRVPGRETLVMAEARRRQAMAAGPAATREDTEAAIAPDRDGDAGQQEPPHAGEVAQAMASLQHPSSAPPASAVDEPERTARHRAASAAWRQFRLDPSIWAPPGRGREPRDGRLPATTLERMEQAYGQRFDDVEIHTNSAEVPAGQRAFTRGRHIYFEPGAFEPGRDHGEHVIAHELAHVAQQARPASGDRPETRGALEADAHQAALAAVAGRAATVNLFAPPSAALGFSNGAPQQHPAPAPGAAGRPPAQSARSGAPAAPSGATHTGGATRAPTSAGRASSERSSGAATSRPASQAAASGPSAAIPRRGANADGLLLPEAPGALTPAAAGRLQQIRTDNQGVAGAVTSLPTADHQTDVARGAVVEPQAEQDAHAQHGVVAGVDDRPPPSPEIEAACAHIRQVIRDKRPPSEDKLVDAKPREMAQEAGNQMSAGVEQRAGTVRQGYADMQQSPQGTPSRTPVQATLPPERVTTPPVDAAAGAPDPLHHEDVSLDRDVAAQNQHIDDAGMNTEPAKLVKDGPIGDARGGADDLQHMAKTDPHKVLADQAAAVAHAQSDMRALQAAAEKLLAIARAGTVGHIATHTTGVKGSEEQQRAQAGAQMQAIFTRTQKTVDILLQPLSGKAVARWEAGVAQLSTAFETALADVKRRIDERHSGVDGWLTEHVVDDVVGLPDWVTEDYDRAEAAFADGATALITDISRDVNQVIEDCKKLIQQARKDIEAIVKSLPASLQAWAQGEAQKLGQKLDQLSQHVDQTQASLNQDLIHRASGAVQEVREQVADLREQAKGLIGKIADAIGEFLKNPAKAIVDGLLRVLGIPPAEFWSLVNRLGDVVGAIAKDPVKFGKALISGTGQGFKQFFEHFPTHLKEILMGWLFGTMGTAGVPMPTDFSGPGIMATVLAIVGIDGGLVSSMLGADISDPAEMAEVHQELAGVLSGDPHALVALLRDHFDPASLLPMIKEAALSFLIQALITRVAPRIAAMLVPGGAILQAVETIFKVLLWVVNNAARIFTLIESLVGAAGQAVAGNVAGVASAVEASLVQIITLVISFLADYIGLGGLGAKLKGVVMKLSGKLKAALKKVIDAIAKRAKARAKTKHAQPKHAPDKHDDHTKPQSASDPHKPKHNTDDDRDPRNHKHHDDSDPRNHKHHDDSDPRNHKHHDDSDPRNHKHHDDSDPTKHEHDEDHPEKDKDDKKKHDSAIAQRTAHTAAERAWKQARAATTPEVLTESQVESLLGQAAGKHADGTEVTIRLLKSGESWSVESHVKLAQATAEAKAGHGWIATEPGGRPWFAAQDLSAANGKVIDDAYRELASSAAAEASTDVGTSMDQRYQRLVEHSRTAEARGQARLDDKLRGLKLTIDPEAPDAAYHGGKVDVRFQVAPNTTERKFKVNLREDELAKLKSEVLDQPIDESDVQLVLRNHGYTLSQSDGKIFRISRPENRSDLPHFTVDEATGKVAKGDGRLTFHDRKAKAATKWNELEKAETRLHDGALTETQGKAVRDALAASPQVRAKLKQRVQNGDMDAGSAGMIAPWGRAMEAVASEEELHGLLPNPAKGSMTEAEYNRFRRRLRTHTVDHLMAISGMDDAGHDSRVKKLYEMIDAQPDNGSRGELFTAYRRRLMANEVDEHEKKMIYDVAARKPASLTENVSKARRTLDDEVALGNGNPLKLPAGKYGVEDKAGPNAFDLAQAKDYAASRLTRAGESESTYQGLIYVFSRQSEAMAALSQLNAAQEIRDLVGRTSGGFHVVYLDHATGKLLTLSELMSLDGDHERSKT